MHGFPPNWLRDIYHEDALSDLQEEKRMDLYSAESVERADLVRGWHIHLLFKFVLWRLTKKWRQNNAKIDG